MGIMPLLLRYSYELNNNYWVYYLSGLFFRDLLVSMLCNPDSTTLAFFRERLCKSEVSVGLIVNSK